MEERTLRSPLSRRPFSLTCRARRFKFTSVISTGGIPVFSFLFPAGSCRLSGTRGSSGNLVSAVKSRSRNYRDAAGHARGTRSRGTKNTLRPPPDARSCFIGRIIRVAVELFTRGTAIAVLIQITLNFAPRTGDCYAPRTRVAWNSPGSSGISVVPRD